MRLPSSTCRGSVEFMYTPKSRRPKECGSCWSRSCIPPHPTTDTHHLDFCSSSQKSGPDQPHLPKSLDQLSSDCREHQRCHALPSLQMLAAIGAQLHLACSRAARTSGVLFLISEFPTIQCKRSCTVESPGEY